MQLRSEPEWKPDPSMHCPYAANGRRGIIDWLLGDTLGHRVESPAPDEVCTQRIFVGRQARNTAVMTMWVSIAPSRKP
jgi:membrane protein YqaA with SNARE-associated domain